MGFLLVAVGGTGNTPIAPDFCAGAYPLGERQKPYLLEREGVAKCAKGTQNAYCSEGQKLTHSPAHEEKAAEQETPQHYSHSCRHQPPKVG